MFFEDITTTLQIIVITTSIPDKPLWSQVDKSVYPQLYSNYIETWLDKLLT